jgi:hypothetical protein
MQLIDSKWPGQRGPAIQLGRPRMLRDMVARWNVKQAHNARGAASSSEVQLERSSSVLTTAQASRTGATARDWPHARPSS